MPRHAQKERINVGLSDILYEKVCSLAEIYNIKESDMVEIMVGCYFAYIERKFEIKRSALRCEV